MTDWTTIRPNSSGLLGEAVEAHGGVSNWLAADHLTAHASISGATWERKGHAEDLADVGIRVWLHRPHVEYTNVGPRHLSTSFDGHDVTLRDRSGQIVDSLGDARATFAGQTLESHWSDAQLTYFASSAIWTYLTTPFLMLFPGVEAEEIAPWSEQDETWRRLRAVFPDHIETHSKVQDFYFGDDGLLRRHDYVTEISGARAVGNYATQLEQVGGLVIPTRRRAYPLGEDNRPLDVPVGVAIDLVTIDLTERRRILSFE